MIKLSPSALVQRVDDEVVVLNLDSEKYFKLNDVAGRVVELAGGCESVAAIVGRLVEEYDAPQSIIERDVRSVIKTLIEHGLLTEND